AVFTRDDVLLSGRDLDHLFVGPLPEGVYTMALRPQGFDRWTFTPGTEESARAVPLILDAGKSEDLGVVELDCGPTVRVEPEIQSQEAVPDLHEATLTVDVKRLPGAPKDAAPSKDGAKGAAPAKAPVPAKGSASPKTASRDVVAPEGTASGPGAPVTPLADDDDARGDGGGPRGPEPLPSPRQEVRDTFIRLRGLPEVKVALALTITHPYFVPSTITVDPADYLLERGREAKARVEVPRLGGAVQFDASLGASVAVLATPDGAIPPPYPPAAGARARRL